MATLKNDRLIRALLQQPVDRTPIWIMRQAGRYLPEYREVRGQAGSFMNLCQNPELACEVTLQPLRRYNMDAAIIFSDILTIPDAMGLGLGFETGEGPFFKKPARTEKDINALEVPDLAKLEYVYDAIKLTTKGLANEIPLIGFCGSPWTLACYVIEGRGKNGFPLIQKMLKEEPKLLHTLLDVLAQSVIAHLNGQIRAGASVAMIFDTWGGMLQETEYKEFSLAYMKQIIAGLDRNYNKKTIPVIMFTKGGSDWIELMADSGADALGMDWNISMGAARERAAGKVALQGNMNPLDLKNTPEHIRHTAAKILASYGKGSGHIFNLGHGITPDVQPSSLKILVDAVQELSPQYHTDA